MKDLLLKEDELSIIEGIKDKCENNFNKKIELTQEELMLLKKDVFLILFISAYLKAIFGFDINLVMGNKNGLYVIGNKK